MKIAIAQCAPVLLDRARTIEIVVDWIGRASDAGARLVCFGEALVPGYPLWLCRTDAARFDEPELKALHARYVREAVDIEAGDLDAVREAARARRVWVVLGIIERPKDRGGHSLFCSCVVIDDAGEVRSVHRKLCPTYEERLAWAHGDAHGLVTHGVDGFTLGALNCYENWMPLPRAALHAQGEDLHVAVWPGSSSLTGDITRFIAREGRSYVISASAVIGPEHLAADMPMRDRLLGHARTHGEELFYDGGSCIAGPDGRWLVEPVVGKEALITAEIDLGRVREERENFDPSGHYARPELLGLSIDRRRLRAINDTQR